MDIQNRRALTRQASESLRNAPGNPQNTVLIYAGFATLLSLVTTIIIFLIDHKIDSTSGLGGMGTRSVLSTVRTVLMAAQVIVMSCWSLGYTLATLNIARGELADQNTLMGGFHRFGPLIRCSILEKLFYIAIAFISIQIGSTLFMLTPMSDNLFELLEQAAPGTSLIGGGGMTLDPSMIKPFLTAAFPMYILSAVIFLVLFIPTFYNFRMIYFRIADVPKLGALAALRDSRIMMRGNRMALFRLDLHLWWFYLAEAAITLVGSGAMILSLLGISLPFSPGVTVLLFNGIYLAAQFALYYFCLNKVQVTYAVAYEALIPQENR